MISNFISALALVFKRLRFNLGLSISAILGIVAVLAIVVCVPIFSNAVSSEILRQQLYEKALATRRSLFSMHMYYLDKRDASPMDVEKSEAVARFIIENSPRGAWYTRRSGDHGVADCSAGVQTGESPGQPEPRRGVGEYGFCFARAPVDSCPVGGGEMAKRGGI